MIDSEIRAYVDARINVLRNSISDLWDQIKRVDNILDNLQNQIAINNNNLGNLQTTFNCLQSSSEETENALKRLSEQIRSETDAINRNPKQKDDLVIFDENWGTSFLDYYFAQPKFKELGKEE